MATYNVLGEITTFDENETIISHQYSRIRKIENIEKCKKLMVSPIFIIFLFFSKICLVSLFVYNISLYCVLEIYLCNIFCIFIYLTKQYHMYIYFFLSHSMEFTN